MGRRTHCTHNHRFVLGDGDKGPHFAFVCSDISNAFSIELSTDTQRILIVNDYCYKWEKLA